ncbi:trypsin zeta-like [Danaus plexippus]|uniref:trypsin zeta-like n=1 Tax=Danaus plexippus TaxID=13037 RepID=UPI002AB14449|nr:trypsin zeta-like [Danaus plexippus]
MSDVCKEFKGWFNSFTRTEIYLTLLQAVFLVSLITIVTFLVLHLLVCLEDDRREDVTVTIDNLTTAVERSSTHHYTPTTERSTLSKDVECTWTPSAKTEATAQYYEGGEVITLPPPTVTPDGNTPGDVSTEQSIKTDDGNETMGSDDELAGDVKAGWLLALVKLQHPGEVLFGCTLTVVSSHWTLTAASCIEAIEEVDTLDDFVMMDRLGRGTRGAIHEVSEVIVHPLYQGVQKSYDLVAIKSVDRLSEDGGRHVKLATLLEVSLVTLGERLSVLGFGKLSLSVDPGDRRVREVSVFKVSPRQCPGHDTWAARHLGRAGAARRDAGGPGALCVGRAGGGRACPCAGAPLLSSDILLGVMSDDGACGVSCGPALYVNIALQRDWLDSVLDDD